MIIKRHASTGDWVIKDNKRSGTSALQNFGQMNPNQTQHPTANNTNAENKASAFAVDILSNGFKLRVLMQILMQVQHIYIGQLQKHLLLHLQESNNSEVVMQLSKHFKLEEFEKSQTATRKGIKNKAEVERLKTLQIYVEILEPVRAKFDKPITITSGYRSPELCEAIGSKPTSQHTSGNATDFEIAGVSNLQVALWIQHNCDFDQLILEYWTEKQQLLDSCIIYRW